MHMHTFVTHGTMRCILDPCCRCMHFLMYASAHIQDAFICMLCACEVASHAIMLSFSLIPLNHVLWMLWECTHGECNHVMMQKNEGECRKALECKRRQSCEYEGECNQLQHSGQMHEELNGSKWNSYWMRSKLPQMEQSRMHVECSCYRWLWMDFEWNVMQFYKNAPVAHAL